MQLYYQQKGGGALLDQRTYNLHFSGNAILNMQKTKSTGRTKKRNAHKNVIGNPQNGGNTSQQQT
jgi:hypothetical protein